MALAIVFLIGMDGTEDQLEKAVGTAAQRHSGCRYGDVLVPRRADCWTTARTSRPSMRGERDKTAQVGRKEERGRAAFPIASRASGPYPGGCFFLRYSRPATWSDHAMAVPRCAYSA